jgi:hypothetical protein
VARGIRIFRQQLSRYAVGLVFSLALFVLYNPSLLIKLGPIHRAQQMAHAVGLHPQGEVYGRSRHILKIVGAVGIRGAIDVGYANFFQWMK